MRIQNVGVFFRLSVSLLLSGRWRRKHILLLSTVGEWAEGLAARERWWTVLHSMGQCQEIDDGSRARETPQMPWSAANATFAPQALARKLCAR